MSGFRVDPPALERFADWSMDRRHGFDELRAQVQTTRLPRDSFGHVPGIGNRVYDAYDGVVDGCATSVTSAVEAMAAIAATLRGVVGDYVAADQAAITSFATIHQELSGTDGGGPG